MIRGETLEQNHQRKGAKIQLWSNEIIQTSPLRLLQLIVQKVPPLCNLLTRDQITDCTNSFHMCHSYSHPITSAPRFTCLPWSFHFTSTKGTKKWKRNVQSRQVSYGHMGLRLAAKGHIVLPDCRNLECSRFEKPSSRAFVGPGVSHRTSYPPEKCADY